VNFGRELTIAALEGKGLRINRSQTEYMCIEYEFGAKVARSE